MQRSALCRSRRELSNAYLLAKIGFDTAENEPCKVCPLERSRMKNEVQEIKKAVEAMAKGGEETKERAVYKGKDADPDSPRSPRSPRRTALRWR